MFSFFFYINLIRGDTYKTGTYSKTISSGAFFVIDIDPATFLMIHNPKTFTGQVKFMDKNIFGSTNFVAVNFTTYNGSITISNPNQYEATCYFTIVNYSTNFNQCANVSTYVNSPIIYTIKSNDDGSSDINQTMDNNQRICIFSLSMNDSKYILTTDGLDIDDTLRFINNNTETPTVLNSTDQVQFTSTVLLADWRTDNQLLQGYVQIKSKLTVPVNSDSYFTGNLKNSSVWWVEKVTDDKYYFDERSVGPAAIAGIAIGGFILVILMILGLICCAVKARKRVSGEETENQLTNLKSTSTVYFFPIQNDGNDSSDNSVDVNTDKKEEAQTSTDDLHKTPTQLDSNDNNQTTPLVD